MEYQGTEDYLSEILFWGVATVWDPNPEKPQSWQKKLQKLLCTPKYRAELFPNDSFASGDVLYYILYQCNINWRLANAALTP